MIGSLHQVMYIPAGGAMATTVFGLIFREMKAMLQPFRGFGLIALVCLFAIRLPAQTSPKEVKQFLRMLQAAPDFAAVIDSLERRDYHPDSANIDVFRQALWQRFLAIANSYTDRRTDFMVGKINYISTKVGHFSMKLKGVAPANGYPVYIALHGGGGGPAEMNDEQWEAMQEYYLSSIDTGIYVAPRGPNNTWDLHFDADAREFYHRILQELRIYAGADPNRIYLLGYSAGGDGVYQLAPRLGSQFAAASMSAGHHNSISPVNLQHLPMLLQVGELDEAYDRNRETVKYAMLLDSLRKREPECYPHQLWVHAGKEHSYVADRRGPLYEAQVISDPIRWLSDPEGAAQQKAITDAPTWLKQWRRNPWPEHLVWDARMSLRSEMWWYWIRESWGKGESPVEIRYYGGKNLFTIASLGEKLEIGLHERMVDPKKEIRIEIGGTSFKIKPNPSALSMARQMFVTADPNFCYWQVLKVRKDSAGKYQIE